MPATTVTGRLGDRGGCFEPAPMNLQEAERFVASETEKWSRSVRLSGAKAD